MDKKRKAPRETGMASGSCEKRKKSASSSSPPTMPDPSAAQGAIEITVDGVVIKGYHIFRRRPLLGLRMKVVPEPDNPMDKDALVVVMPPLDSIPTADHDVVTDTKRSTTVRHIAGKWIGRLPAGLSTILRRMKAEGEVAELTCVATGEPRQSFAPWPMPGQKGGGAVIPCKLHVQVTDRERAIAALKSAFESDLGPEKAALVIV
ncbi:PREDICTED: uncharacterized protein LOC109487283 [Branchiostoma belcheri]|uniref:Uncharacterized protein LOC109487283 n=1 Tax=Branchiostoma belcheri TaxID=7741 RepID=A0A6P5AKS5_BRABE|nr:PREDICTED: uncharacterized protein LOC109487283 [Branchiostoma belcheri]